MAKVCKSAIVTGRVQGVYFRGSTKALATRLGLAGYAKNCANGSVEVLVCRDTHNVDKLIEWLHKGPEQSHVDKVETNTVEYECHGRFKVC